MPTLKQVRAFAVHTFTAIGAALALVALVYAVDGRWTAMFLCLGIALIVDGTDGTMARYFNVAHVLPRWSGDVLDLVVDFVTYVFVPAYAIAAGPVLPSPFGVPAGAMIVITGALYFADRNMKFADHYFRGFPALWNAAAFYLFLLKPSPWAALALVAALGILTFSPFKFLHPMRVKRLRMINVAALVGWSVLAVITLLRDLDPGPWVTGGLLTIGAYFLAVGLIDHRRAAL